MRRSLRFSTVALAGALALACADQPTPSEPTHGPRPSFRTEQNPGGAGALVVIVPEAFGGISGDPSGPPLTTTFGATFGELLAFCRAGESPPLDLRRLLLIRPDGSIMSTIGGARLPLLVWQTAVPAVEEGGVCNEDFLRLPHLEGTGHFIQHDNDVTTSGNRANAAGFQITGQVSSAAAERFLFSGEFHIVILRSGEIRSSSYELSLKPVGG
jgi:hypothetical protein